jgi:hypothetical protein
MLEASEVMMNSFGKAASYTKSSLFLCGLSHLGKNKGFYCETLKNMISYKSTQTKKPWPLNLRVVDRIVFSRLVFTTIPWQSQQPQCFLVKQLLDPTNHKGS